MSAPAIEAISQWWNGSGEDAENKPAENVEVMDSARSDGPSKMSADERQLQRMQERRREMFGGPSKATQKKKASKQARRGPDEAGTPGKKRMKTQKLEKAITEPAAEQEPAPKPRWERLRAGTKLSVYWEGSDEYFDCKILDWRVAMDDEKNLVYTHRCLYPGGVIEHDLSVIDFTLAEGEELEPEDEAEETGDSDSGRCEESESSESAETALAQEETASTRNPLTPRRKWLAAQEAQLEDDLQSTDRDGKDELAQKAQRGRAAMRRVREKAASKSRATPTAAPPVDPAAVIAQRI
jgi:hypothetical protein